MIRISSLSMPLKHTADDLKAAAARSLHLPAKAVKEVIIVKKSIDARKKPDIKYVYGLDVVLSKNSSEKKVLADKRVHNAVLSTVIEYCDPCKVPLKDYDFKSKHRPVIVGSGPAGLFCAYKLALSGLRPILIERGKDVDSRTADVNGFWNGFGLNCESNVQFGEGGAGTFSDGKLNTMVHDSYGRIREVFKIFVEHGADESILYLNKPHLGTDMLSEIIRNIRKHIIELGGEVRFNTKLTAVNITGGSVHSIIVNETEEIPCEVLVLAIGHSARDTFLMLKKSGIAMERKPFAIGVRVQHPQELIGFSQYGEHFKELPAADYKLTYHSEVTGRGVYSFCMCPGGFVVNASSEKEMLAVNGMSNSDRSEAYANSAIVVTVGENDIESFSTLLKDNRSLTGTDFAADCMSKETSFRLEYSDYLNSRELIGVLLQKYLERAAFRTCDGAIPVEYYSDFKINKDIDYNSLSKSFDSVNGRCTSSFTNTPNTKGAYRFDSLSGYLPGFISSSIREAFPHFERQIKGFGDDCALLMGLESRTSSPVKIIRDENFESISCGGLYPCGEGAGYAGGITSAAVDGIKVYERIFTCYNLTR